MGEYKEGLGTGANCTKCVFGVTTFSEGSTSRNNCSVLMPGYYAAAVDGTIVTKTVICPQGYFCPGGAPNTSFAPVEARIQGGRRLLQVDDFADKINKCPGDAWTVEPGATNIEQCREYSSTHYLYPKQSTQLIMEWSVAFDTYWVSSTAARDLPLPACGKCRCYVCAVWMMLG
jgi:hypothetical protein